MNVPEGYEHRGAQYGLWWGDDDPGVREADNHTIRIRNWDAQEEQIVALIDFKLRIDTHVRWDLSSQ